MLMKKLGLEAIEKKWEYGISAYYKIPFPSTLIIPEGCEKIGDGVFWSCWIRKVVIPESVKEIGERAFRYCTRLKKVEIPKSVERIGDCAFDGCLNANITIKKPRSRIIKYIGQCAFGECKSVVYVKEEVRS